MTDAQSLVSLKQKLDFAQQQLKSVDEDIKRVIGRDPTEERNALADSLSTDKAKNPDDDINVSVASSVVRITDSRSRLEATKGLKQSDKERGRRMFGVLQNTLDSFRADSLVKKPQLERRQAVDAKLEAKAKREHEEARRERADLFQARRDHQIEVGVLRLKMRLLTSFELWKTEMEKMHGFCRTSKGAPIFFAPKQHNSESLKRVSETRQVIDDLIAKRRKAIDLDLQDYVTSRRGRYQQQGRMIIDHISDDDDRDTRSQQHLSSTISQPNHDSHQTPRQRAGYFNDLEDVDADVDVDFEPSMVMMTDGEQPEPLLDDSGKLLPDQPLASDTRTVSLASMA